MNDSNELSDNKFPVNTSTVRTNRRPTKRNNRANSLSPRRSKRTRPQNKDNLVRHRLHLRAEDAMGSLVSADNTTNLLNNQSSSPIRDSVVQNDDQNGSNSNENQIQRELSETPNLCIDLTEDDSVVNENNVESDPEIQCISTVIQNSELCIVRDIKRRNRQNRTERSRSPTRQSEPNDEIIEIADSQTTPISSNVSKSGSTPIRKSIKCPVCLDDYSMFRVSGKQLVSTNCGHLFCDRCIKEVIKTSKSCPNCRKKIATQKSFHPIYL